MNMHAPLSAYPAGDLGRETAPAFSAFARAGTSPRRRTKLRLAGMIGVLAVHGLVLCAYFFVGPSLVRVATEQRVTLVNDLPDLPKPVDPPPMPKLAPPLVYVPVPIMPEIELTVPPPPRETITVPPAPVTASPPDAPFVSPQSPKPVLSATAQADFAARLFAHLNRYKRYPEAAKLRHEEGIVSLRFTMDRAGNVLSAEVAKSSGSKALDQEARALIQRAQPLPPIPAEFRQGSLELVVPVEFSLR